MGSNHPPCIFLSYSSRDREAAERLHMALETGGIRVWRDRTRLETDWSREIADALANEADALCLLWSPDAGLSRWVKHEWLTARALEKRIFPCLLGEAPELPEPLRVLDGIRFSELDRLVERISTATSFHLRYDYSVLPSKAYIPFKPNPEFRGRQTELLQLYLSIVGNLKKIGINQVGIGGMGGIGKTQLAVEFAYRFSFAFDHVFWIQAAAEETWLEQFVEIARDRLGLAPPNREGPITSRQYLLQLQAYCKEHPQTLIVMDNVGEPNELNSDRALPGLAPLELGSNLLFTTRRRFDLSDVGVLEQSVDILGPDAAYRLLTSERPPSSADEEEAARSICNAVGRLPLAIVLIAAFIKSRPIRYADYLGHLRQQGLGAIDLGKVSEKQLATRHKAAVSETLAEDWKLVQDPVAQLLCRLLSLFPEAAIVPKARLGLLAGREAGQALVDPLGEAFVLLRDLHLVEDVDAGASGRLHPLVRDFLIDLTPEPDRAPLKAEAASRLSSRLADPACLARQVESRGIEAVIADLATTLSWDANRREARLLHRMLDRERGRIRGGGALFQQLHRRAFNMGLHELAAAFADAARREGRPFLRSIAVSAQQDTAWLLSLQGHTGAVASVCLLPDGRRGLSGAADRTLILWDLDSGQALRSFKGHASRVRSVSVSADSRRALSGSSDNTLILWDLQTGQPLRTLRGHSGSVESVCLSADGRRALSGSLDKTVILWDADTGEVLRRLEAHDDWVTSVSLSPDGRRALSGSHDDAMLLWDLESGDIVRDFDTREKVATVCFASDGLTALSASYDSMLLWDLESGDPLRVFEGRFGEVRTVAYSPDCRRALSGFANRTVVLWDLDTGDVLRSFEGHTDVVSSVSFSADGRRALSSSYDQTVIVWDLEAAPTIRSAESHSEPITSVQFSPDGASLLTGSKDSTLILWSAESGQSIRRFGTREPAGAGRPRTSDAVATATFTPDGQLAISGSYSRITQWRVESAEAIRSFETRSSFVVALSPDGQRALTSSRDPFFVLRCWDTETGQVLPIDDEISSCCLDPEGRHVLTGGRDGSLRLWDVESGKLARTLEGHGSAITSVSFTPDGSIAVSASEDNRVTIWWVESGEALGSRDGERGPITCAVMSDDGQRLFARARSGALMFWDLESREHQRSGDYGPWHPAACPSPDGRSVLSGDRDGKVVLFDARSGKGIRSFERHAGEITSLCFSADARRGLSGAADKTVVLWDLESGQALRSFEGHSDAVTAVSLSADGRRALSGSADRTSIVWDVESGTALSSRSDYLGAVRGVCLGPDGRRALSLSEAQAVVLWDVGAGQPLRAFKGHATDVTHLAFLPDGRRAVSVARQERPLLWELASGRRLRTLATEGNAGIGVLTVTGDGARIVTDGPHAGLLVWDAESGEVLRSFARRFWSPGVIRLSPDDRYALTGHADGTLVVTDLESGDVVLHLRLTRTPTALDWRGRRIAVGDARGVVSLYEFEQPG